MVVVCIKSREGQVVNDLPLLLKEMSRKCDLCGKSPSRGFNVSRSRRKTKRRWLPNLQSVRADLGGKIQRIRACTACIRSGKVIKPLAKPEQQGSPEEIKEANPPFAPPQPQDSPA